MIATNKQHIDISALDLNCLTETKVVDLKIFRKEHGLAVSDSKDMLIKRVLQYAQTYQRDHCDKESSNKIYIIMILSS